MGHEDNDTAPRADEHDADALDAPSHAHDAIDLGDEQNAGAEDDALTPEQMLQRSLDEMQREKDDLFARLQRVSADYQNYMRRAEQNLVDTVELARGDVLKRFVPLIDVFDQALGGEPSGDEAKALLDAARIVRDELLNVLNQSGVERIDVQVGDPFDPHLHEAMLQQPADGVEPQHVSLVLKPGYLYRKRTLRPAQVAVAPGA